MAKSKQRPAQPLNNAPNNGPSDKGRTSKGQLAFGSGATPHLLAQAVTAATIVTWPVVKFTAVSSMTDSNSTEYKFK